MALKLFEAKDELNLAEFPLCVLGHRTRPEAKTLHFQDRIWDAAAGQHITRQLTITGSDSYGLPTALDDEVLLGLVQLSRQQGFAERKVSFTRYQLIRLLNWRDESKSYERIETSLNRWTGVTLLYSNAWWNKERRCWVDEKFHVLDNVRLYRRRPGRSERPGSLFVWNEVLFESFRGGNLKSLDLDFFRNLRTPTAKRLYRFLDKRFYHRKRWEFGLKELAWEHIGLARSYDVAGLKRRLRPGIQELEERGFLKPMPEADRFQRICTGEWRVRLEKFRPANRRATPTPGTAAGSLVGDLVARGVTAAAARLIGERYPVDQIRDQIAAFDWLQARDAQTISRNPAGYLVRAIEQNYSMPKGLSDALKREHRRPRVNQRLLRPRRQQPDQKEIQRQQRCRQFWSSLSADESCAAEREALAQARPFQRRLIDAGGSAGQAAREAILDAYALHRINCGK
ncbi:MAG: replication initiator protein A [Verrucomicrobia bacterium]|nr:replication initiator protein A [Verrucomicrobiota bacterium]